MNKDNPIVIASENCGISVEEIIKGIGISQEEMDMLEQNPKMVSIELLELIEDFTGVSVERLRPKKKISGPKLEHVYESKTSDFISLIEERRTSLEAMAARYEGMNDKEVTKLLNEILDTYNNAAENVKNAIKKPVVCAFGNSDTGKSTLINYFLGARVAKTDYSPLTSAVVYYEHIKDMPEYLKNTKGHNAFVFGEENNGIKSGRRKAFTHDDVLNSRKAKKYLIASGEFNEVIEEYSSREGANYRTKEYKIYEIVVYLENDILRELSFVDIPGFGSGDENDDIGLAKKMYSVDILFYLMLSNGFMRETDQAKLQMMLKQRKNLDGMYILSTQADILGSPMANEKRLDSGFEILMNWLTKKQEGTIDAERLRRCFYAFDTRNTVYCRKLNESIEADIPRIITDKVERAKEEFLQICDKLNTQYKEERIQILENRSSFQKKSKESEEEFIAERKKELRLHRRLLKGEIEKLRRTSIEDFDAAYKQFMTEDNLIALMEEKKLKNKKEEIQNFSTYVSNEIGDRLSEVLGKRSEEFSKSVNNILARYEQSWNSGKKANKLSIDFGGFDFQRAFAAGLTGVGTYGALAVWATIVASGSNLGAYILVAKVVSALSAIGISLGGTSTVISAVSAIGGPVTLGIAMALLSAVAVFGLFSVNWKKRLAKDLIKAYEKQKCKAENDKQIHQFWDDTLVALDECLKSLDERLLEYYQQMRKLQERLIEDDEEFYEIISYIYYTVCNVYSDLNFKISVDKQRIGNSFFVDRKNEIETEIQRIKEKGTKYTLRSDIHDMEGLVFLNAEELQMFRRDLTNILNGKADSAIALTDNSFFLKRDKHYAVYYKIDKRQVSIRYLDTYPYLKENYEKYKDLIINTYVLKDDQIRYKVFDMLTMAQKEILMIMPWINEYGWDDDEIYGWSIKQVFKDILSSNERLNVKILVGYDLQHPDSDKELKTEEMAKKITEEFREYANQFKIYTKIGTHEKILTIDNTCSLDGSYNLLSNNAPYKERDWAGESMTTFENPYNIERHRREILERANLSYRKFA